MAWSNGMAEACQKFINVAGPIGHLGHDAPNGSTMVTRLDAEGRWKRTIGENLAYGT